MFYLKYSPKYVGSFIYDELVVLVVWKSKEKSGCITEKYIEVDNLN